MKYASWTLAPINDTHLNDPQAEVLNAGGKLVPGISNGSPEDGSRIIGYVIEDFETANLDDWNFQILTKAAALELAQLWNSDAHFDEMGFITVPRDDLVE